MQNIIYISDGTGVTAETLGKTLLTQFSNISYRQKTIPFIKDKESAIRAVEEINKTENPIVFSTIIYQDIIDILKTANAKIIDLLSDNLKKLSAALNKTPNIASGRAHSQGNLDDYNKRISAIEFALEHDDGASLRSYDTSDIILIAPSRCGKTPITMYLAMHSGLFVANYPLINEDFETNEIPLPLKGYKHKLFGILSNPSRLSEIRQKRRPNSTYSSLSQCTHELKRAKEIYIYNQIPFINSASQSVEEMSSYILRYLNK